MKHKRKFGYAFWWLYYDTVPSEDRKINNKNFGIGKGKSPFRNRKNRKNNQRLASIHENEYPILFGVNKFIFEEIMDHIENQLYSRILNKREILAITLEYLKSYPGLNILSLNYGISMFSVRKLVFQTISLLIYKLQDQIQLKSESGYLLGDNEVIGVIDGTRITIRKPTEFQRRFYSGDKHKHCINSIVVCDEDRKILFAGAGCYGIRHDAKCVNLFDIGYHIESSQYLLGDGAFKHFNWCLNKSELLKGSYNAEREVIEHLFYIKNT